MVSETTERELHIRLLKERKGILEKDLKALDLVIAEHEEVTRLLGELQFV